ncbi:MAG: O-antigen ligase family protein [Methylophilaceae bacterium]|nr:O-antigen ligase family protein [Methyloradius sp.]
MVEFKQALKSDIRFLELSRWMGLLCAFGIPWSNACFNIGFYCMLIFLTLSLFSKNEWHINRWQTTFKTPLVIIGLSLFALISLQTLFSNSHFDLAEYDFIHYRKLLAIPLFVFLFNTTEYKKKLFISYCLGAGVLMLPTLLDGSGIANLLHIDLAPRRNAAYSTSLNGVANLVYWRNQIVHGFDVSILFAACSLGTLYSRQYRIPLLIVSTLCAIDLLFFVYGRMALLSLVVAIFTIAIIQFSSKKYFTAILAGLLMACSLIYFSSDTIKVRLNSITNEESSFTKDNNILTSGGQRLHYWHKSWQLFKQSPIIGNGSGSFRQSLIDSQDPLASFGHRHTHNEYLTQLAQYGLVGFLLFISLITITLINAKRIDDKWLSAALTTAVVLFSLNAVTDSSLHNDWEGWAFVVFVSIACVDKTLVAGQKIKLKSHELH